LQGIPAELEEAARIDGATRLGVFRHVTIPLMTPVIFFQLIMALIGSLQAFALPMLIYGSGNMGNTPPRPVYLYVVHTYRQIFAFQRFGYGTAMLWMLFVIILALTLLVFRSARYWVHYEEGVEGEGE
jgi:multiple sugar transport system permease protein